MYPPLGKDHQVFGTDFCSGYVDKDGNWNNGFYCPQISPETSSQNIFCCGDAVLKYCCTGLEGEGQGHGPPHVTETEIDLSNKDYDLSTPTPSPPSTTISDGDGGGKDEFQNEVDIARNSTIAAVICGLVTVTVLMTLVACFYCKCCLLYKKRRSQLQIPGGLYRIPASSTTCGINLLNSSANNGSTPSSSNPASFHHSHHSAFVATANSNPTILHPIPILDPWGGAPSLPNSQGQLNPNPNYYPPTLLRNNVGNHNQAQILNELLRPVRTPPFTSGTSGNLAFLQPQRTNSPENSSISSISTISSIPTSGNNLGRIPQQSGVSISRTNSIPPTTTTATAAVALRLQRQLLQTHYQNQAIDQVDHRHRQQIQLQNRHSLNVARSNSASSSRHQNNPQDQYQYGHSYPRSGGGGGTPEERSRSRSTLQPEPNRNPSSTRIYTVGSRSSYHPTTLSSFLNSVNFSPGLNRSASGGSLPPPYFVEQYRIRNRVRVPRNPPQPQGPQQPSPTSGHSHALPSYDDIEPQFGPPHPQSMTMRESHPDENNRRPHRHRNERNFPNSQHNSHPQQQNSDSNSQRPHFLVLESRSPLGGGRSPCGESGQSASSTPMSSPTTTINLNNSSTSSPLNDLSAPGRRPPRNKNKNSNTARPTEASQPGPSPSRRGIRISNQIITLVDSSNVGEDEYDPSDKILNTVPLSPLSSHPELKRNSENLEQSEIPERNRDYKSQSLENVNIISPSEDVVDLNSSLNVMLQKTESGITNSDNSRNPGAENVTFSVNQKSEKTN